MKKKFTPLNWPRTVIIWGILLAIIIVAIIPVFNKSYVPDFEAYCPFGGIQALGSYLLNSALACSMTSSQIVMGIFLLIGVLVFSKLFCSYICPIGTLSEWLGKLGDKLNVRFTIKGLTDKVLRSLKYILLFITAYYTLQSNELFCKTYDPYYAITTGFGLDVVILYASIAIAIVILGSVFIRLFWCKYLCPLGAISNIFMFTGFFVGVLLIYFLLIKLGINISYVWPLAVACLGGYIIEIAGQKSRFFPIARITRNEDTCTSCQLCTIECPQGIDVADVAEVHDADCNLCGDCLSACPEEGALQINKKKSLRWLPPIATIVLVLLGLYLATFIEVPTIDQKWYGKTEMDSAGIYTLSGLKSVKCYGSSMAFAAKMKKVKGVLGVATYVGTHKVKVYYDPKILNEDKIQQHIFSPEKTVIRTLSKTNDSVKVATVGLDHFFDTYDFGYLSVLLKQKTKAIGLQTEYSCPVIAKIFFSGNAEINKDEFINILESKKLDYLSGNKSKQVNLDYKVTSIGFSTISKAEYISMLFSSYKIRFNNYHEFNKEVISVYRLKMGKNSTSKRKLPYLVSNLSNDKGIIGVETLLDKKANIVMDISFVDTITKPDNIYQLINSDTLRVSYRGDKKGKVANMFHFKDKGMVVPSDNKKTIKE